MGFLLSAQSQGFQRAVPVAIKGSDHSHKEIRIENSLTDKSGQEIQIENGARVELTIKAAP